MNAVNDRMFENLVSHVRQMVMGNDFEEAEQEVAVAMGEAPHEAQPHNLMGIILERKHDHVGAMKHFRAAWALDPTFLPARVNMERYASFEKRIPRPAFDESDCPQSGNQNKKRCRIEYDQSGVGHVVMGR